MSSTMVNGIATQSMAGVVSIGDSITVETILYDVDTPRCFKYPIFGDTKEPLYTAKKGTVKTIMIHNNTTVKSYPHITFGYSPISSWIKKV